MLWVLVNVRILCSTGCKSVRCLVCHYSSTTHATIVLLPSSIVHHLIHVVVMCVDITFRKGWMVTAWQRWMSLKILIKVMQVLIISAHWRMLLSNFVEGRCSLLLSLDRSAPLMVMSSSVMPICETVLLRDVLFEVNIWRLKDIPVSIELFLIVWRLFEDRLHRIYTVIIAMTYIYHQLRLG